jgi:hypothetical protein
MKAALPGAATIEKSRVPGSRADQFQISVV